MLPTPEFWPGEFHGLYSGVARGCKESDMTEKLSLHFTSLFSQGTHCGGGTKVDLRRK